MKALSLFSGIGGIDLACEWAGIETVAFCEREPFPQKVLRKHWPSVPIYDDVCTLTKKRLDADGIGTIDIIHGGYPCQPFSNAGNRQGTEDDRHLWPEVFRLIQALQPRWFVGENVAGHVTLGLDIVLTDLESIGYSWETFVIPAVAVDARHRRDRVFIVAYSEGKRRDAWWTKSKGQQGELRTTRSSSPSRSQDVADTYRTGCQEQHTAAKSTEQGQYTRGDIAVAPDTNSKSKPQASSTISAIGSEREPWDDARWSSGRYEPGTDWWAVEPSVGRVANGVPNRVDRLKALGNAVVPQQIYPIIAAIKQIDDMMRTGNGLPKATVPTE